MKFFDLFKIVKSLVTFIFLGTMFTRYAFADGATIQPVESEISFYTLLQTLYGIVFPVAIIFGFFKVVMAGYLLMTSQGDPQRVQAGHEELTSAIMGMLFILGAVGILRVIIGSIITGGNPGF